MEKNKLALEPFTCWNRGENFTFSACMKRLMERLGGDPQLFTYEFFAGLSGDDFVMCYGGDNGQYNDCVSACDEPEAFLRRTFGRIGLAYSYVPSSARAGEPEIWKKRIRAFVDRGVPVLVKEEGKDKSYSLLFSYEREGAVFTTTCGAPESGTDSGLQETVQSLEDARCSFIFIDSLPVIDSLARVYRESLLQLPELMQLRVEPGVVFGAQAYRKWAGDLLGGRYDGCTAETFQSWEDWCIYICNLATNARHGWDFIARAYVYNPDMPYLLHLIALLDRNKDVWKELEALGFGFHITAEAFQNREKCALAASAILKLVKTNEEILRLFKEKDRH